MFALIFRLLEILLWAGIPPSLWKLALICPVWKKGDWLDPSNYRPVVLLSTLYKGVERVLLHRLLKAIEDSGGFHGSNLAYQKGKGREMALFLLIGSLLHHRWRLTGGGRKYMGPYREPTWPSSTWRVPSTGLIG